MKKNNKKYLYAGIAIVGLIAILILFTPIGQLLNLNEPQSCTETPYNSDCYCNVNEEQLVYTKGIQNIYYCESLTKAFDIYATDWQQQAENFVEQTMAAEFPQCNMISCDQGDANWQIWFGVSEPSTGLFPINRDVYASCFDNIQGKEFASFVADLETGEINLPLSRCGNYSLKPSGTSSIKVGSPDIERIWGGNNIVALYGYNMQCPTLGTATSDVITWSAPKGITILNASIDTFLVNGQISSIQNDKLHFQLDGTCGSGSSGNIRLYIQLDPSDYCKLERQEVVINGEPYCEQKILHHTGTSSWDEQWYNALVCENGQFNTIYEHAESCDDSTNPPTYTPSPPAMAVHACIKKELYSNGGIYCIERQIFPPEQTQIYVVDQVKNKEWCPTKLVPSTFSFATTGYYNAAIENMKPLLASGQLVGEWEAVDVGTCNSSYGSAHGPVMPWHPYL